MLETVIEEDDFIRETARLCSNFPPYFIKQFNGDLFIIEQDRKFVINISRAGNA